MSEGIRKAEHGHAGFCLFLDFSILLSFFMFSDFSIQHHSTLFQMMKQDGRVPSFLLPTGEPEINVLSGPFSHFLKGIKPSVETNI